MGGDPSTFGAYTIDAALGDGRFGPVFHAHAPDGVPVVIRLFSQPFSSEQREHFIAALGALCAAPLEHPSIARPLTAGRADDDRPYVVHSFLAGTPLSHVPPATHRRALEDIVNRLTYVAGALDFAAAANIFHGALSAADVIFSADSAGVSGLGLAQAMEAAGVAGFHARREDDVAALMTIAGTLLGRHLSPAAESLLSGPVPSSALAFAAALHDAVDPHPAAVMTDSSTSGPEGRYPELPFSDVSEFDPGPREPVESPHEDLFEPESHHVPDSRADDLIDAQLRHDDQQLSAPAMFGSVAPAAAVHAGHRRRGSWLVIGIGALALGIFAGFGRGFLMPREAVAPAPVVRTEAPEATPGPDATSGRSQTFTDAPVDEVPKPPAAAATPAPVEPTPAAEPRDVQPEPAAPKKPARPARPPAVTPPARSGPAAMQVDSRPVGAQIFVDGQSVGYTPLVIGDLSPGTHSVRMQLPGYRPWVTAVTLRPGARERVAASLEQ